MGYSSYRHLNFHDKFLDISNLVSKTSRYQSSSLSPTNTRTGIFNSESAHPSLHESSFGSGFTGLNQLGSVSSKTLNRSSSLSPAYTRTGIFNSESSHPSLHESSFGSGFTGLNNQLDSVSSKIRASSTPNQLRYQNHHTPSSSSKFVTTDLHNSTSQPVSKAALKESSLQRRLNYSNALRNKLPVEAREVLPTFPKSFFETKLRRVTSDGRPQSYSSAYSSRGASRTDLIASPSTLGIVPRSIDWTSRPMGSCLGLNSRHSHGIQDCTYSISFFPPNIILLENKVIITFYMILKYYMKIK